MKLNSCFIKDYKEQNEHSLDRRYSVDPEDILGTRNSPSHPYSEACVQTYKESPLRLLEKIKNFFNETKNFLEKDWNIFSKNCNDSFAKCSSRDVVTKPDCNCLYPKATPSSDLASASPHQPPAPSMAPLADLAWDDSQRTEGSSLLPSDLPLRIEDPGSAKQRPPRSTCQTLESTEQPNHEDPQPHPSAGAPIPGVEDIIESSMGTNWVLEEASGEASEGFLTQERKFSPSNPVGGSIQAETDRPWARSASSPFPKLTEDQQPTNITDTPLTEVNPMRPTGQTLNNTPEKTDGSSTLREDQQEPRSPHFATLNPQRVGNSATPYAKLLPPKSHSWGIVLPLGELEGKKSTRDRRSPAELKGGPASEGAARPVARFNSIPLTDTGSSIQDPQTSAFVFWVLGIILVLLAVGGLLFYSWKRRSHRDPRTLDSSVGRPEGSSLAQDEDRQVELPV